MSTDGVTNVLIVGVGGQGIIRLSDIIAEVAFGLGHDVKKSEIHGLSQRGGSVTSHIRWGKKVFTPVIMDGEADFIVVLEELEGLRNAHVLKPSGTFLVNEFRMLPASVITGGAGYPEDIEKRLQEYGTVVHVRAAEIARELGNIRVANIAMLGAFSKHLDIPAATWCAVLKKTFPEKHFALNLKAFEAGRAG